MKQYDFDIEDSVIGCIFLKPKLISELYVESEVFQKLINRKIVELLRKVYSENKNYDIALAFSVLSTKDERNEFLEYYYTTIDTIASVTCFYEYQEQLINQYRNNQIKKEIVSYSKNKIDTEELVDRINKIQSEILLTQNKNKVTPEEMISMIRNKQKVIIFPRFWKLNEKLRIKKKTINVIGARPSEGKSALALNLFCDLAKDYKCLYFNMEMTEEEVYERMLGIESNMPIKDIIAPQNEHQDEETKKYANMIYNYKYEVINGSKTINSIKNKIIKEQREEHLIVFIDYVGYIVGKADMSDKDRIGNAVRELNNITKDYNCTIFLVAQINRNGSDIPTMQDLKDSGEIEQTADTIILIHDDKKEDTSIEKEIGFLIPKCRGGKRGIRIPVIYNKEKQRMEVK